jgi:predicted DNA-binding transcriptional regulator AlpA
MRRTGAHPPRPVIAGLPLDQTVTKPIDSLVRAQPLYPPRGMSRTQAAAYVGVSPSLFDEMVKDGRMPGPKQINARVVWDRFALDAAFEALPDKAEAVADDDWQVAL